MELNEYQKKAMGTCMPSCDNFSYMFLNLVGEVGELASKAAKHIRKEQASIRDSRLILKERDKEDNYNPINEWEDEMKKEAGDVLWQLSGLCAVMGWSLEEVAWQNLLKLASRAQRGVIDGNGDNR